MRIVLPSLRRFFLSLAAALLAACGQAGELYLPPPEPQPSLPEKAQPAVVASPDESEDEDAASRQPRPQSQDTNR